MSPEVVRPPISLPARRDIRISSRGDAVIQRRRLATNHGGDGYVEGLEFRCFRASPADSQTVVTSLSNGDVTATADSQKALTSLAVAAR
ncbi:MAG: hypothetical protein V5A24_08075, partial [Haloarculaceae archaeon]